MSEPIVVACRSQIDVLSLVPPGDSVLGVEPFEAFRIAGLRTHLHPGLFLLHDGSPLPFDGLLQRMVLDGPRTLDRGGAFLFHIRNETPRVRQLTCTLWGSCVELVGGKERQQPVVGCQIIAGRFIPQVFEPVTDAVTPPEPRGLQRVEVAAEVPPGKSLVCLYPSRLLEVQYIRTTRSPASALWLHEDAMIVPCEGQFHALGPCHRAERLHFGSFLSLSVLNVAREPQAFACTLWGLPALGPRPNEFSCSPRVGETPASYLPRESGVRLTPVKGS